MIRSLWIFIGFIGFISLTQAQYLSEKHFKDIRKNVYYLSSDKLEGRAPGTKGEELASNYIAKKFKKAGVLPGGENKTYFQSFEFSARPLVEPDKTYFRLINKSYELNSDFWPLGYSANGVVKGEVLYVKFGIRSEEQKYNDYEGYSPEELNGKIFVIENSTPDGVHPHSKYLKEADLSVRIQLAESLGAAAVIFVQNYQAEEPGTEPAKNVYASKIPVIFVKGVANKILLDGGPQAAEIGVSIKREKVSARNVVGWIDNGAAHNIIIGAHYDHLGWGEEGSLYRGDEKMIHNGADDNASGTAALIGLAQYLSAKGPKNNNYVFIAFSAEEKGLLGSSAFVKSDLFSPEKANYMLNMDMVGRLEEANLALNGVGTSSVWAKLLPEIKAGNLNLKTSESGIGPSDHTSFYLKDIPVLHFFTGTHADYHKPSDDAELINYRGIQQIGDFIVELIHKTDQLGRIDFQKTKDAAQGKAPKYSVTLGIVPDYMYDGPGVKVDGVSEGKPASVAGIQTGDIVVGLGDVNIDNMQGYMKALGQFKKGNKVQARIIREGKEMELTVAF